MSSGFSSDALAPVDFQEENCCPFVAAGLVSYNPELQPVNRAKKSSPTFQGWRSEREEYRLSFPFLWEEHSKTLEDS